MKLDYISLLNESLYNNYILLKKGSLNLYNYEETNLV